MDISQISNEEIAAWAAAKVATPNREAEKRKPPALPLPTLDSDGRVLYFAYGSNLDLAQMRQRCPDARPLYPAVIAGWRIAFCGYSSLWGGGVATLVKAKGATVEGTIWSLSADCVRSLDMAEGAPTTYEREEFSMVEDDGKERPCITYVHRRPEHRLRPSKRYFRQILDAYKREGFDVAPLRVAFDEAPRKLPPPRKLTKPAKRVPTLEDNMCTDERPHLVFVYGSLMHGYGNHRRLEGAEFVGEDALPKGYTMVDVGYFPGLLDGGKQSITGELYRVDDETLEDLDQLEGAPDLYYRKRVRTDSGFTAWVYILRFKHSIGLAKVPGGSWREYRQPGARHESTI